MLQLQSHFDQALLRFAEPWHPVTRGRRGVVAQLKLAERKYEKALRRWFRLRTVQIGPPLSKALPALRARRFAAAEGVDDDVQTVLDAIFANLDVDATTESDVLAAADLAAQAGYQSTMTWLGMEAPSKLRYTLVNQEAKAWLGEHYTGWFKSIDDTTAQLIGKSLSTGLSHGEHLEELGNRVANVLGQGPRWRARMIAQTETIAAHAEAAERTAGALGLTHMEWLDGQEGACKICRSLHGKIKYIGQSQDTYFESSMGSFRAPPAHPNCRCTLIPHYPDDIDDLNLPTDDIKGLKNAYKACGPRGTQVFAEGGQPSFCETNPALPDDVLDQEQAQVYLKMGNVKLGQLLAQKSGIGHIGKAPAAVVGKWVKAQLEFELTDDPSKANDAFGHFAAIHPQTKAKFLKALQDNGGGSSGFLKQYLFEPKAAPPPPAGAWKLHKLPANSIETAEAVADVLQQLGGSTFTSTMPSTGKALFGQYIQVVDKVNYRFSDDLINQAIQTLTELKKVQPGIDVAVVNAIEAAGLGTFTPNTMGAALKEVIKKFPELNVDDIVVPKTKPTAGAPAPKPKAAEIVDPDIALGQMMLDDMAEIGNVGPLHAKAVAGGTAYTKLLGQWVKGFAENGPVGSLVDAMVDMGVSPGHLIAEIADDIKSALNLPMQGDAPTTFSPYTKQIVKTYYAKPAQGQPSAPAAASMASVAALKKLPNTKAGPLVTAGIDIPLGKNATNALGKLGKLALDDDPDAFVDALFDTLPASKTWLQNASGSYTASGQMEWLKNKLLSGANFETPDQPTTPKPKPVLTAVEKAKVIADEVGFKSSGSMLSAEWALMGELIEAVQAGDWSKYGLMIAPVNASVGSKLLFKQINQSIPENLTIDLFLNQKLGSAIAPKPKTAGAGVVNTPSNKAQPNQPGHKYDPNKPPFDPDAAPKVDGAHLGGAHSKSIITDPDGGKWLFKPADAKPYQASAEYGVQAFANAVGLTAPEVYLVRVGGRMGSLQRILDIDSEGWSPGKGAQLNRTQLIDLQKHQVLDWLFSQHDSNAGAPLFLKDNRVVMIDKGQAFKFWGKDELSPTYNPNAAFEPLMVHNDLWASVRAGKVQLDFDDVRDFIQRVVDFDDQSFLEFVRQYGDDAHKSGVLPAKNIATFESQLLARKHALLDDFEKYYRENGGTFGNPRPRTEVRRTERRISANELDDDALVRINETTYGQSFLFDEDFYESMDMQIRPMRGSDGQTWLRVEGKLRNGESSAAFERRLKELAEEQGVKVGYTPAARSSAIDDLLYDATLTLVKHVNTHGKVGGDGVFNAAKLDPVVTAAVKLGNVSDQNVYLFYKQKYEPIYKEMGIDWNDLIDKDVMQLTLQKKVAEKAGPVYAGPKFSASSYTKPKDTAAQQAADKHAGVKVTEYGGERGATQLRQSRVDYDTGQLNGLVEGYNLEFPDGTRVFYNPQGAGQQSAWGTLKISRPVGERITMQTVRSTLNNLDELGLPSSLAQAADVETLYIMQHYRMRKITPPPPKAGVDRVTQLLDDFQQRIGIRLDESPDYDPSPRYDSVIQDGMVIQTGKAWWQRADIPQSARRKYDDKVLSHRSSADARQLMEIIDESGGWLQPTEFRFNHGVGTNAGMSASADRASGGASYLFTRMSTPQTFNPAGSAAFIEFKTDLLERTTTVHYPSDMYGRWTRFDEYHIADPEEWTRGRNVGGDNERLIKNGVNLLEWVETLWLPPSERQWFIDGLRSRFGEFSPYDGRRWEEIVKS